MIKLLGEYDCSIDAKGRLRLPSALLRQLGDKETHEFVLNRGFEKCLNLYPVETWEKVSAEVNQLNEYEEDSRIFKRYFLAGANMVEMDNQDRILISKRLMDYASIEKDVILMCVGDKVEIWNASSFDVYTQTPPDFATLAQKVMGNTKL